MSSGLNKLSEDVVYGDMESPVGKLTIIACNKGLRQILWEKDLKLPEVKSFLKSSKKSPRHKFISLTKKQLKEYFNKKRTDFNIPLAPVGTDFQKETWKNLLKIPYGEVISYQTQATWMGDAKKARAVGTANSKNPISIIVPCHRVVAKSGKLSGFAGGLNIKQQLLDLEA